MIEGNHFQGLREPFSQPKFHPLHSPANGHRRVKSEGQENGYGRYCNHSLRRALPRTPRDVAVLLSAGYLTVLTLLGIVIGAEEKRCRASQARRPASGSQEQALDKAGIS